MRIAPTGRFAIVMLAAGNGPAMQLPSRVAEHDRWFADLQAVTGFSG
jgi:hypothetical protein